MSPERGGLPSYETGLSIDVCVMPRTGRLRSPAAATVSSTAIPIDGRPDPAQLRHPLERRVETIVSVVDVIVVLAITGLLLWGAEWLEARPALAKYEPHAQLLLALVLGAPLIATFIRRRRRMLAQEDSIRIDESQLPDVHAVLVRHCRRVGIPVPELYISDTVEHTTSFAWRRHRCIILSTHDFAMCPEAFDDVVDFMLAREVGSICLGYISYRNELLASWVAPIPFLRYPLNRLRTFSRDRYGAFLAPRSFRALIAAACSDRLRNRVGLETYLSQLDEDTDFPEVADSIVWLFKKRVPLGHRIRELHRAGMLSEG